jgi:hypothetical protein
MRINAQSTCCLSNAAKSALLPNESKSFKLSGLELNNNFTFWMFPLVAALIIAPTFMPELSSEREEPQGNLKIKQTKQY